MEVLPAFFAFFAFFSGRNARFVKDFSIFAPKYMPMTLLNELLDELRDEAMARNASPAAMPVATDSSAPNQRDAHTERLHRVLVEMGQVLDPDEQPPLDAQPPSDEICLRILNHWEQFGASMNGIREHIASLDRDISLMQPWGDFDVMKVEQLKDQGVYVRFWRADVQFLPTTSEASLYVEHRVRVISQDAQWVYFVTIDDKASRYYFPPHAEAVEICPCPISTLIMLQTRDKDSLRRIEMLRGDYALAHYAEVYAALRQALPPGQPLPLLQREHRSLRQKIHQIFRNS